MTRSKSSLSLLLPLFLPRDQKKQMGSGGKENIMKSRILRELMIMSQENGKHGKKPAR